MCDKLYLEVLTYKERSQHLERTYKSLQEECGSLKELLGAARVSPLLCTSRWLPGFHMEWVGGVNLCCLPVHGFVLSELITPHWKVL